MADETHHIKTIISADSKDYETKMSRAERTASKFESSVGGKMAGFGNKVKAGFGVGASGASNFIQKVGPVAGKIGNVMAVTSGVVLAGSAVVGKAFVGMAVSAIKSASELQVVNAQYSQVFQGIESEAGKAIDGMSKQWNIVPQRLKEPMSAFQSFFKGVGQDGPKALNNTTKAMTIAADSSAFYDKSLEEVQGSLKGFLMGNYENGDAIGVNTNLTKIATKYNEQYGGSFQDLSDSAQQDYLLEYIANIQKANGVVGQATREQNNFSNVMGNLQSKIETIKGTLGSAFLQPLLDGLNRATPAFDLIGSKIDAFFKSAQGQEVIRQFGETVSLLADKFIAFASGVDIGAIATAIGNFVTSFTNGDLAGTVGKIVEGLKGFATKVGEILPKVIEFAPTLLKLAVAFKALSFISTLMPLISGLGTVFTTVLPIIGTAITAIAGFFGLPAIAIGILVAAIAVGVGWIVTHWEQTKEIVGGVITTISNFFIGLVAKVAEMASGVGKWVSDMASKVGQWFSDMGAKVRAKMDEIVQKVKTGWNNAVEGAKQFVSDLVNSVQNFFGRMASGIATKISEIVTKITTGFSNAKARATEIVSNIFTSVTNFFGRMVSGIATKMSQVPAKISEGFSKALGEVREFGSKFFEAGANIVGMIADGIKGAIGKVTGAISEITQKIRNFLPFSPAKEGPLDDLHKLNFGGTISTGIYNAENEIKRAMNSVMTLPELSTPELQFAGATGDNFNAVNGIDGRLNVDVYSTVDVNGRELARSTQKDMTREQQRETRYVTRSQGYR